MIGLALISSVGNIANVFISLGQGNCVPPISPGHPIVWMLGLAMAGTCV